MTREKFLRLLEKDSEIKQFFYLRITTAILKKITEVEVSVQVQQTKSMAALQRSISDYARPRLDNATLSIVLLQIVANKFELKLNFI